MAKMPWSRIREAFEGHWVEITEYAWKAESIHPQAAKVRHHSPCRKELLEQIAKSGRLDGSVVLFVGPALPGIYTSSATAHASNF
jgi:hypothetical protein